MNKIIVFTSNRADYNKLKIIIDILNESPKYKCYLIVYGSHVIKNMGNTIDVIEHKIHKTINTQNDKLSMNDTYINGLKDISNIITDIDPDGVIIHGDRYDTLGIAMSCILLNKYIIHVEGGEVSGTVDGKIRHAITKLSNCHLVANEVARKRLLQMGETPESIHITGCPSYDKILSMKMKDDVLLEYNISNKGYIMSIYHPVTTNIEKSVAEFDVLLESLVKIDKPVLLFYPNIDDGSDLLRNCINNRIKDNNNIVLIKNIAFEKYINLIYHSGLMIGNSSSIVRESCIFGVPSILIGTRQDGRVISRYCKKIKDVGTSENLIENMNNMFGKRFPVDYLYGNGKSKEKIKNIFDNINFGEIDKTFYEC